MSLVKHNNNSISEVTSMANLSTGAMTLIKEITASSDSSISFVDGSSDVVLDDTYPVYKFEFINIHPSSADTRFQVNFSTDSGSNYNVTKTSTFFFAYHGEIDDSTGLVYDSGKDLAQSTANHNLNSETGNQDSDKSLSGNLHLYNPSSDTFVKHFMSSTNDIDMSNYCVTAHTSGYGNTTSSIDAVRFAMSSGNIDSGTIKLYGIKDS